MQSSHTGHAAPLINDTGPNGVPFDRPVATDLMTAATKYVKGADGTDLSRELNAGQCGGPGKWVHKPGASSPERAARYQEQITGKPFGNVYVVDGREFDGMRPNPDGSHTLLEAKGPGLADKLEKKWFKGSALERKQLEAQNKIAEGHGGRVEWHVAEAAHARALQQYVESKELDNTDVIWTPAKSLEVK